MICIGLKEDFDKVRFECRLHAAAAAATDMRAQGSTQWEEGWGVDFFNVVSILHCQELQEV